MWMTASGSRKVSAVTSPWPKPNFSDAVTIRAALPGCLATQKSMSPDEAHRAVVADGVAANKEIINLGFV